MTTTTTTTPFVLLFASSYICTSIREGSLAELKNEGRHLLLVSSLASLASGAMLNVAERKERGVAYVVLAWSAVLSVFAALVSNDPGENSPTLLRYLFVAAFTATGLTSSLLWASAVKTGTSLRELDRFGIACSVGQILGSLVGYFWADDLVACLWTAAACAAGSGISLMRGATRDLDQRDGEYETLGHSASGKSLAFSAPSRDDDDSSPPAGLAYVAEVGIFQFLNCAITSLVLVKKLDSVSRAPGGSLPSEMTRFSSKFSLLTAAAILSVQLAKPPTSSVPHTLLSLPLVTGGALLYLALIASLPLERRGSLLLHTYVAGLLTRTMSYAVSKSSRESLFGLMSRNEKYTFKPVIDGVVCKLGQTAASFLALAMEDDVCAYERCVSESERHVTDTVAFQPAKVSPDVPVTVILVVIWLLQAQSLLRRREKLLKDRERARKSS